MLVLSRKMDEKIVITSPRGDEIEIKVMEADGADCVKLAVDAPTEYAVDREEIHRRKKKEG